MKEYIKKTIAKLILAERSPSKLTKAICWGIFNSLAPIPGFHTPLIFVMGWVLRLNIPVIFSVVYIINNPFSMIPIYAFDYLVGYWLLFSVLGIDLTPYDPAWMTWFNNKVGPYISSFLGIQQLSLWYFIFGGLIVATTSSILAYPLVRSLVYRLVQEQQE